MRKFAEDFGHEPSIDNVELGTHNSQPAIIVSGYAATPPAGMPTAIRLRNSDTSLFIVRIIWKNAGSAPAVPAPVNKDLDLDMWAGAPPITDRQVTLWTPSDTPIQVLQGKPPEAADFRRQASVPMRIPQFVKPNFWSKPFDQIGNVCLPFYDTWTEVYSTLAPNDYMLIIRGISYEFTGNIQPFDQFEVRVRRDSEYLAQWFDMMAIPNPDPALSYTFGGHIQPIPFYGRIDHNQRYSVDIRVLGPYPFTKTSTDTLGGCVTVRSIGWLASLYDNRDGGSRPVDMGDLNHMALGEKY